jgi:hypothetical protein
LLFFPPLLLLPPPLSLLLSSSPLSPLPLSASPSLSPLLSSLQSSSPLPTSLVVLSLHRPLVVLRKLVVASPLVAPPSRPLVVPPSRPLVVLSLHHPLVVSSHRLVVALPLVAPPSCHLLTPPLSSSCAGWFLRRLSSCCPLFVPPSRLLLVLSLRHPLVVSSHRLVVALPLVAPPSRRLLTPPLSCRLAPAGCCIASRRTALSSCRPLVLSSSFTLNSLSLGFPDPFDVTFVVKIDRGRGDDMGACNDTKLFWDVTIPNTNG